MNEQYEYVGKTLTPKIAQELIIELLGGATVQKQEIVIEVDEAHTDRGGQLPTTGVSRPVTHALSKMKQSGLAENPEHGVWVIKPARIRTLTEFMNGQRNSLLENMYFGVSGMKLTVYKHLLTAD